MYQEWVESLENRTLFSNALSWSTVAPMPVPRAEGASFVADGKFFCFGGFSNAVTLTIPNEMDAYDPVANTWTRVADCPVKVNDNPVTVDPVTDTAWCGGFFLNDGFHASGLMYAYHVQSNTWTQEPSLPMNIGSGQMGIVGREMYYFGGRNSSNVGSVLMWKLNLDNPSAGWTADEPMLYTSNHDGAVNLNNKIYAIGGIVNKQETTSNEKYVQVFDPSTDQWTLAAPMPIGLGHIASAVTVADGDIIVAGGQVDGSGQVMSREVLQYDPASNSWTQLSNLPSPRVSDFVGYLDGKLIVTGGNMYSPPYINTTTWAADYGTTGAMLPAISIANASAQAGGDEKFSATLSAAAAVAITARYNLTPGTATSADFDSAGGTLTIPAGAIQATIDVPTFGDSAGASEQFTLTLSGISSNATFADGKTTESATGTIMPPVVWAAPSMTVLNASASSISVGDSITFTATVTDSSATPTGTVSFADNGMTIGSAAIGQSGAAVFTTSALVVGTNSITASYSGDAAVAASAATPILIDVADPPSVLAGVTTTLTASANILVVGQNETLAISVVPNDTGPAPTGTVTILDDGTSLAVYPLASDGQAVAMLAAASVEANASYTAIYSGDGNYGASTSNAVLQTTLAASPLVGSFGKASIPITAVAGQPILVRVPSTFQNSDALANEKGKITLQIYADTADFGLTDQAMLLDTLVKKVNLKPGKRMELPFSLKTLPSTLMPDAYRIVLRLTDPAGDSSIITSPETIAVAAPKVTLFASVGAATPATIKPGRSGFLPISITNTGNITARGPLNIQVIETDGSGNPVGVTLAIFGGHASIKAGHTARYHVRVRIPSGLESGSIDATANIALDGISMSVGIGQIVKVV